jgi:hypothetical protein
MVISSNVHSITVTYDPRTDEFSFIDANKSSSWTNENRSVISKFNDAEAIANMTRNAFEKNLKDSEALVLNTTMFVAKTDSAKAIAVSKEWRDEMREIHCVTPDKVKVKDKSGGQIFSAAIRGGDVEITKALHTKSNFFHRHRKKILGFVALGLITGLALAITAATLGGATPLAAGMIAGGITIAAGMAATGAAVVSDHLETRSTQKVDKLRRITAPDNDIEMRNDGVQYSPSSTRMMSDVLSQLDNSENSNKERKRRKFSSSESEESHSESLNKSDQVITAVTLEGQPVSESEAELEADKSDHLKMRL